MFDLGEGKKDLLTALKLALLFFFILLQGGFHIYVWCIFFLLAYMFSDLKKWKGIAVALAVSGILSAFRLLPALAAYAGKDNAGSKGYPTIITLLSAMIIPQDANFQLFRGSFGWFEYNLFTDITGFALIAWFAIWLGILVQDGKRRELSPGLKKIDFKGIYLAMLITLLFTFDRFYGIFAFVPFLNSQSAALRMVIVPFTLAAVIACARFDAFARALKSGAAKVLVAAGVLLMAGSLVEHAELWKIKRLESLLPPSELLNLSLLIVDKEAAFYKASVLWGYSISLLALLIVIILLIIHGNKKANNSAGG